MKTCFRCGIEQPLDDFYRHPRMADGHLNKCKTCTRKDTVKRVERLSSNLEWMIKEKDRCREKSDRNRKLGKMPILTPEVRARVLKEWADRNPEKILAHRLSQHIAKQPCSVCGDLNGQKHHEDYSKPLDITWLCAKHHAERHVQIRREKLIARLSSKT